MKVEFVIINSAIMEGIFSIPHKYKKGGIVVDRDNIYSVSDSKTALSGDEVFYHLMDGVAIIDSVRVRGRHLLSGILEIKSNIIYGVSSKGGRYYLFRPTDPRYPPFIVLSKIKPTDYNLNIYVVITFLEWTTKYPRGNCEFIIGEIGNHSNEIKNRLYRHLLGAHYRSPVKMSDIKHELMCPKKLEDRRSFLNHNIVSIDPVGCRDIDDALHCEIYDDHYVLGIHIADVDYWVPQNSKLDLLAFSRMTSIYTDHEIFHMLPTELATNHCSLLQNQERYALSLLIKIDLNGNLISYEFVPTLIKVQYNITYETADTLLNTSLASLYKIINLYKSAYTPITTGSHYLVEKAMILANTLCAETLLTRYGSAILRTHYHSGHLFDGIDEPELVQYMNTVFNQAAEYTYVQATDNFHHHGLNLTHYTHFTSPIRRYIDIVNHRLLKGQIVNDLTQVCNQANIFNKHVRRFNRDLQYLKVVNLLQDQLTTYAYIIKINPNYSLKIFIPEYQLTHTIKIYDDKLKHLHTCQIDDTSLTINHDIKYKLYSKIMVHILAIPKHNTYQKKLRIIIQ